MINYGLLDLSEASIVFSHAGHSLSKASVVEKILFKALQLFEQQIVGLMDEDNRHVGNGLRGASLAQPHEVVWLVVLTPKLSHCCPFC